MEDQRRQAAEKEATGRDLGGNMNGLEIERPGFAVYYFGFGYALGKLVGIVTFIGAYVYCIATYGFLFGFGLGWLPAMILAVVAYVATIFLWAPAIVPLLILVAEIMK